MGSIDIYKQLSQIESLSGFSGEPQHDNRLAEKISEHRQWLRRLARERPDPERKYKVGVYIRYFNQTKYENYLDYHIKQFADAIEMCPKWELVGIYIDEGMTAPRMEKSPEWSRLLTDCMDGKVDLIITQKISNISQRIFDVILCARMLATQEHPIGMYFVSEDLFTLASYYQEDLRDTCFFPELRSTSSGEIRLPGERELDHDR